MSDPIDARSRLGEAITRQMTAMMEEGQVLMDQEGHAVLDDNGRPMRVQPTAAMMQAAIKWHQQLGREDGDDTDPMAEALKAIREANGGKMPDLDDETDDAATR